MECLVSANETRATHLYTMSQGQFITLVSVSLSKFPIFKALLWWQLAYYCENIDAADYHGSSHTHQAIQE